MFLIFIATVWAYGGDPLNQMDEIPCYGDSTTWGGRVELRIRETRWNIAGLIEFNTRVYHYVNADGELVPSVPGPTIKMKQGHQCLIVLINELPARGGEDCIAVYKDDGSLRHGYFCSDTTNLHTHGLWVDPNEDYMGSSATPGGGYNYTYNIQPEHMPGTFWYHAHHHGSAHLSLYGGQFGALLMEPSVDWNTYFHYDVALTKLYEEAKILVMSHAWFGGNDDVNGYLEYHIGFWNADYLGVAYNYTNVTIDPNVTFQDEHLKDFYVVNNQYRPVVQLPANYATLLRIIHASGGRILNLIIDQDEDTGETCEVELIARDGIFQYTPYPSISNIYLMQGTRADVAVICPPGTYNVRTEPNVTYCPITGWVNHHIQETVFTIIAYESETSMGFPTTEVTFPWYLESSCNSNGTQPDGGYYSHSILTFTHIARGFAIESGLIDKEYPGYAFQGHRDDVVDLPWNDADNPWIERYCMGEMYDLKFLSADLFVDRCPDRFTPENISTALLENKTCLSGYAGQQAYHPYHQHVMPFQVVRYDKGYDQGLDEYGDEVARLCEWRDVIPGVEAITIRIAPRLFKGDVVTHCHITQHSDHGMAGFFDWTDKDAYCFVETPTVEVDSVKTASAWATDSNMWFILAIILIIIVAIAICVKIYRSCAVNGTKVPTPITTTASFESKPGHVELGKQL